MRNVQSIPLLRIILPFITGILFYKIWDSSSPYFFLGVLLLALVGTVLFNKIQVAKRIRLSWIKGILLNVLIIALGFLIAFFHHIENWNNWYKNHTTPTSKLQAKILTPLKETDKTYKTTVQIIKVFNKNQKQISFGEAIVYFRKSDSIPNLQVSDNILFANKLNPIISKGNPSEFDYAEFCENRGIYEQAFLTENEWIKLAVNKSNFQNPLLTWHEGIKGIITKNITDSKARGIALALITGYRDDIDKQVYTQYTKTGLVHLLAISGLHMGIFYYGTVFFLGLIPFFNKRKRWLIITSLLVMWLFALITTFPPSVQRASVMFTFLGIGQLINRRIPSINFLFASAFFLLLFQPHLLFEVGFQLSYSAVLGILLFFRPIRNWYYPKNKIIKFFWEIMCLSLSAQIFTFPVAIYYFHQLPILFLFTNLVAIPMVMLIIYGEIIVIILSIFSETAAAFIGKIVAYFINFLNSFIEFTSSLSFVSIQNINISLVQCILLLSIMLCIAAWFLGKRKLFAPIALSLLVCFMSISIHKKSKQLAQQKVIIYNASTPYIEFASGDSYCAIDTISESQKAKFKQYTTDPSHLNFGITRDFSSHTRNFSNLHYDLYDIGGKSMLRIKKAYKLKVSTPITVDYLILSDKWIKDPQTLLAHISANEIIIDGNIPLWKSKELKSQLSELNLPLHFIGTDGAKIISL